MTSNTPLPSIRTPHQGAALDVFEQEPPPKDHPLVGRPDVVCTPHLGASTNEAQEAVAVEIAEAVVGALRGELAATAVNAPMVPAEVLTELKPYVELVARLGAYRTGDSYGRGVRRLVALRCCGGRAGGARWRLPARCFLCSLPAALLCYSGSPPALPSISRPPPHPSLSPPFTGKIAVQLASQGVKDIKVTYNTGSPDTLDARLLRAMMVR